MLTTLRIGGVRHDPVRRALADCLIRFANQTGTDLIAEGIEEPAELDTWTALGAHAEVDDRSRFSGSGLTGAYTLSFYTFWF